MFSKEVTLRFANQTHKERYYELIKKDNTTDGGKRVFFYIFAYGTMFYAVDSQYDFDAHLAKYYHDSEIETDRIICCDWYSTGEHALASLAFHLLNDRNHLEVALYDIFGRDSTAKYVALMAISFCFGLEISIPGFIE